MFEKYPRIYVEKSNNNDTRTCDHMPSQKELLNLSEIHIQDVSHGMDFIAHQISSAGRNHDFTKITHTKQQWEDFKTVYDSNNKINFCDLKWCNHHNISERHHLNDFVPEDVNLIDVIEMIVDCVMAGKARSNDGIIYPIEIKNEVLQKAVQNTMKLVENQVVIIPETESEFTSVIR